MNYQLRLQAIRNIVESSSEDDSDHSDNYMESSSEDEKIITNMISQRYLRNKSTFYHIPKSDSWYKYVLFEYDEKRFRTTLRMNKQTFWTIVNMIKDHPVFSDQQKTVEFQLSVTLFLLGGKSTIWNVASRFGISIGSVAKYTQRIITAIQSLRSQYIVWPHGEYRKRVINGFAQMQGFPNVIGVIDGTHINLFEAPSKPNKDVYINRKRRYAIHVQGVVDHLGQFTNYDIGWPASVHDAKVFTNSSLYTHQHSLFQNEEDYILADSAYPISKRCIPSFKVPTGQQILFNKKHNKTRVVVEQAFGRLKNRFQFLKEIRNKDTKLATKVIDIALILHNIVERNNDIWILTPNTQLESTNVIRFVDNNNHRRQVERNEGLIKRQNLLDIVTS